MAAWVPAGNGMVLLIHERTHQVLATSVELAVTRRARRVGLLGRTRIDTAAALVLAPCFAIHTAFMRFPIDVLFVDRTGRAVRVVHGLEPWRAAIATRAHAVIELAAGALGRHQVEVGDQLYLVPSTPNSQIPNPSRNRPRRHGGTENITYPLCLRDSVARLRVGRWELGVEDAETRAC